MKKFNLVKMTASSLALGAGLLGGTVTGDTGSIAQAKTTDSAVKAAKLAGSAANAFAAKKFAKAITLGEAAVSLEPTNMGYRLALGEFYFGAGRFKSAATAFEDVLDLSPGHSRAALKLSLAQIALGEADDARSILAEYKDQLPIADYGLAIALAGDADGAVSALEGALRAGTADARGRQNLALAYALAGKWAQSRVLAAQDLSPDLVDARMTEWAALARPKSSYDQVATILRINPVYDPGQPVQLALARTGESRMASAAPAAPAAFEVARAVDVDAAPAPVYEMGSSAPAPIAVARATPVAAPTAFQNVVMGPRQEIVQRIPAASEAPIVRAAARTFKTEIARSPRLAVVAPKGAVAAKSSKVAKPVVSAKPTVAPKLIAAAKAKPATVAAKPVAVAAKAKPVTVAAKAKPAPVAAAPRQTITAPQSGKKIEAGQFVVQLGAFGSKGAAEAAWSRLASKVGLNSGDAVTASVKANGTTLHRLAASGFGSAAEANAVCAKVKAAGGQCFVRSGKADETIRWAFLKPAKPTQLASR